MQTRQIIAAMLALASVLPCVMLPAGAQTTTQTPYSLRVDNPIVFIASDLVCYANGPNNTLFTVVMVNMTNPAYIYSIYGGMFNETGEVAIVRRLTEGLYPAGRYWLNLTVDDNLMSTAQVSIVFDEKFILLERIKEIVGELTAIWGAIRTHNSRITDVEDRQGRTDWLIFGAWVIIIIMFWLVAYCIVARIIKAKMAYWKLRAAHAYRKKQGLECSPVTWSDVEHEVAGKETAPNLNPVPTILKKLGVPAALANECMWDCTGDFAISVIMEKELSWSERRKLEKDKDRKVMTMRRGRKA